MNRPLFASILFLLPLGCASPTEIPDANALLNGDPVQGVTLSIAQPTYRHGADATVHLVNNSAVEIGYNSCSAAREILTAGEWVRIESLRVCTAALYPLAAGERTAFQEAITSEWQPARYRIVLSVWIPERAEPLMLKTHPFDVTP